MDLSFAIYDYLLTHLMSEPIRTNTIKTTRRVLTPLRYQANILEAVDSDHQGYVFRWDEKEKFFIDEGRGECLRWVKVNCFPLPQDLPTYVSPNGEMIPLWPDTTLSTDFKSTSLSLKRYIISPLDRKRLFYQDKISCETMSVIAWLLIAQNPDAPWIFSGKNYPDLYPSIVLIRLRKIFRDCIPIIISYLFPEKRLAEEEFLIAFLPALLTPGILF